LHAEGYITWQPRNERKTNEPTAETDVAVLTNTNEILVNEVENILRRLGYTPSKTAYSKKGDENIDRYGRRYTATKRAFRLLLRRKDEVRRILSWLGPTPHPMKEAYRAWALRLILKMNDNPIRWTEAQKVKDYLGELYEKSAYIGRRRANRRFHPLHTKQNDWRLT